jgi:hypothetical protein
VSEYGVSVRNVMESVSSSDSDADSYVIIKVVLYYLLNTIWEPSSGQGPVEGSCEHGNEPSGSIKCWEILE